MADHGRERSAPPKVGGREGTYLHHLVKLLDNLNQIFLFCILYLNLSPSLNPNPHVLEENHSPFHHMTRRLLLILNSRPIQTQEHQRHPEQLHHSNILTPADPRPAPKPCIVFMVVPGLLSVEPSLWPKLIRICTVDVAVTMGKPRVACYLCPSPRAHTARTARVRPWERGGERCLAPAG